MSQRFSYITDVSSSYFVYVLVKRRNCASRVIARQSNARRLDHDRQTTTGVVRQVSLDYPNCRRSVVAEGAILSRL